MPEALLDTDTLSLYRRAHAQVTRHAAAYIRRYGQLTFTELTRYEVLRGLTAAQAHRQLAAFELFSRLHRACKATAYPACCTLISTQEKSVRGIVTLIAIDIPPSIQKLLKGRFVLRWHLDTNQHAPVVSAVVAVVKQADIPGVTHARQKVQEGPGAFGKFETIQELVVGVWSMTTDHVTDVQLGHFVVAEIKSAHTMLLEGGDQGSTLIPALHLHAHEDHGLIRMRITIIEFSNVTSPQQTTEGFKTAWPLWDDGCQHRLTLFPKLSAFGDMA